MSIFLYLESFAILFFIPLSFNDKYYISTSAFWLFYLFSIINTIKSMVQWIGNIKILNIKIEHTKWINQTCRNFYNDELESRIVSLCKDIHKKDANKVNFSELNMPYGRTVAFLSYFNKSIDAEEPVYYSPKRSPDDNELREYGTLITTRGIYISNYNQKDIEIPFSGIWKNINDASSSIINVVYNIDDVISFDTNSSSINLNFMLSFLNSIVNEDISLAIIKHHIKTELDKDYCNDALNKKEKDLDIAANNQNLQNAGIAGSVANNNIEYAELKNNMNGARGNGYGSEYGNAVLDRALGKKVENKAAELDEHGRQVKAGADKAVNGINIQTKYYKSASESIGAAFEHKKAVYLNPDGSMMQIEVPRDQYQSALTSMQKRIDSGQVPGAKPGDDPKKYVKRGYFTYEQSFNLTRAGSIEGITVDIVQGTICSLESGTITTILSFATAVWNGKDIKEAAKCGLQTGMQVMGKSVAIYTVTMQISRGTIINPFKKVANADGTSRGFAYFDNPVFKLGDNVAKKINSSNIANTHIGKAVGLDKVTGRKIIGGTVTAVVVFGPDLCRAFQGKISTKQLFKNSTVSVAGMAGAAVGNSLLPVVGGIIGGAITGFVAKKVMDSFIEDDAKEMFQILKEEFLDVVMLYSLNKKEFDEIISLTIGNKNLSKIMQDMFAAEDSREYAREGFIEPELETILIKRKKITDEMYNDGMKQFIESEIVA